MWLKKKKTITCNNVKLTSPEPEMCRYAFVDSREHQADRILTGALIPVRYEPARDAKPGDDYELRVCSFKERYESWFLCCMSDLEWVLDAEPRYASECERMMGASVVIRAAKRDLEEGQIQAKPFNPSAGLRRLGLELPNC